mmetsp:Transcript_19784/g.51505  ORF Transcript_19784/g.51505 Transcript_19784/m.51505 type:complete len:222 (-) Transcript_19784:223-888(-)
MRLCRRLLGDEEWRVARHLVPEIPSEELGDGTRANDSSWSRIWQRGPLLAGRVAHKIRVLVHTGAILLHRERFGFDVCRLWLLVTFLALFRRRFGCLVYFVLLGLRLLALFVHTLRNDVVLFKAKDLAPEVDVGDGLRCRQLLQCQHDAERFFGSDTDTCILVELARANDVGDSRNTFIIIKVFFFLRLLKKLRANGGGCHCLGPSWRVSNARCSCHVLPR